MIKAIVYVSNTGFTKRYAEMLAEKIGVPMYKLEETKGKITSSDEIVYMGWIMAGGIKGFEKARKKFNIKVVCAVGMGSPKGNQSEELLKKHNIENEKLFYLQGGFSMNKLHGIYKLMMKTMEKVIKKSLEKKLEKTEEDIKMLDEINNGSDYVSEDNIIPVVNWIKENN
jgi:flavodoxin